MSVQITTALDAEELKCKTLGILLSERCGYDSLDELREDDDALDRPAGSLELEAAGAGAGDEMESGDGSLLVRP